MGVHGLWKLIDSAGKPIPVETLENKVLAVDVSIWLYQLVRGFQEGAGKPIHSAYLLGLFHRICKLLFFRIKPIFVFDGGVPSLKKKTIAARQRNRQRADEINEKLRQQLLENLIKQQALGNLIGEDVSFPSVLSKTKDEIFRLPPLADAIKKEIEEESSSDEEIKKYGNLHDIDVRSEEFLALPADMRHDILTELKETRKQNSWANVHLMPEESMEFSSFQMKRLLKRRAVQEELENVEEELGARGFTLSDLQTLLTDQGVDLSQRIAMDNTTRFVYSSISDPATRQKLLDSQNELNLDLLKEEEEIFELERDISNDGGKSPMVTSDVEEMTQEEILKLIDKKEPEIIPDEKETNGIKAPTESSYVEKDMTQEDILNLIDKEEPEIPDEKELTQEEILKLIKLDNSCSSKAEEIVENYAQTNVNDQAVEHGKNSKENKCLKLDHGSLSRADSYCQDRTTPQKDSPLSSNQEEKGPEKNILHIRQREVPMGDLKMEESHEKVNAEEAKSEKIDEEKSESSDDDFLEVSEPKNEENLEIVIDTKESLNDDFFADVFTSEIKTENLKTIESKEEMVVDQKPNFQVAIELSQVLPKPLSPQPGTSAQKEDTEQLIEQVAELDQRNVEIMAENKKGERMAASITEQLTMDAQELLQLFGIPYLIAPMEAEAQCAYLDFSGQTDGTITDDSDIWLFGANNVYKNFFDQKKFVKQFKASDIQRLYKLKRDDLIMIAMLVGSDYTVGIRGIGPVNAIDIVAHFPPRNDASSPDERLRLFREAYHSSRLSVQLQRKLKSIHFTEGFPSSEIVKAYCLPRVDDSKEKFKWSDPDVEGIRQFAQLKLGWDFKKTDETLKPILEKLKQRTTQRTIHNYFNWSFQKEEVKLSKRVSKAVDIMTTGVIPSPPKIIKKEEPRNFEKFGETSTVIKSKTPAQVAREKAAKKLKEIRQREKEEKAKKGKKK